MSRIAKQLPAAGAFVVAAIAIAVGALAPGAPANPTARQAATCSDYSTQADAQRAADTRDADGDGVYASRFPARVSVPGRAEAQTPPPRR